VLYRDNDEVKSINGELISFKEDKITIKQKKENIAINLSTIEEAKIKLKW
jgi:ribosome maturation factor RimP